VNRTLYLLPVLLLLAAGPAVAARIYTVDPKSGEITVTEGGVEEEPAAAEKAAACPEDEKELRRLGEIIRRQQEVIRRQQAIIARLQEELRRKENIIQGLDLLRRQGR
jgi:hypothetical protein